MHPNRPSYTKVKNKYLKFIKSQEVLSEPFRNKIGQLNNFYLPISKMIAETYLKKKKNTYCWFNWWARIWEVNYFKYFKNYIKSKL